MAGLLDFFDDPGAQLGLGLLAAASPRADGAGFGQRLNEGFSQLGAWKQQKQKSEYLQSLMDEQKAKAAQEQAALQAAKAKRDFLPNLWQSPSNAGVMQIDATGNPVAMSSQPVKQVLNVKGALANGYTPEELAKIDGLRNIGLDKVARTITFQGQDGKEYEQQVDEFGRPVSEKVLKYRAPIMQELGGKVDALDPYSLQPRASFQKTMTFADKTAAGNLDLSRQRFAFDQQGGADANKWTFNADAGGWIKPPSATAPNGSFATLPGGTGSIKKPPEAFMKAARQLNDLEGALDEYKTELGKNKGMLWGTGAAPSHLPIPFTDRGLPLPQGKDSTNLSSRYTSLMMGLKNLYELGALAGPDMKILEGNMSDPASFSGWAKSLGSYEVQNKVIGDMLSRAKQNLETAYGHKVPAAARVSRGASGDFSNDVINQADAILGAR